MEPRSPLHLHTLIEEVARRNEQVYFLYHVDSGRFHYLNQAFVRLWEHPLEDVYKAPDTLLQRVHPQDRAFLEEQYRQLLKLPAAALLANIEFRIVLPDEQVKWLCLQAQVLADAAGERYLGGYMNDITQQRAYMRNMLKFMAKKNSTLEILSHDLAAFFSNIEGLGQLMHSQLQKPDNEVAETLRHIQENARRGTDMIRDFVDNEFMESSQISLNKKRMDLAARLAITMENYKQNQQGLLRKQFELIRPAAPVYMYLDELKFMQVINNLISNAIKFTRENGRIAVTLEERPDTVLVTVEDDGIGIPEALQPNLFDKFTSARRPGLQGEKTVGLGMSIIRNIVNLHGGRIWFKSQEHVGSIFYIELPKM